MFLFVSQKYKLSKVDVIGIPDFVFGLISDDVPFKDAQHTFDYSIDLKNKPKLSGLPNKLL